MSLFLHRGGGHEQEQTQKQKEGFLSRVLKQHLQDKRTQEDEEKERRPSLRTRYHRKQSENLWGERRLSGSSRIIDIKRIHRRLSGSSRREINTSRELFAGLGLSEGSLDPNQIDAIADDEIGDSQSTSKAKAAKDMNKERGIRRKRSATKVKTDQKKESAQTTACGDSDKSIAPEDGFYDWPSSRKRLSIDSNA